MVARLKNPYHLFVKYRRDKNFKIQKDSAAAIKALLRPGAPGISDTMIGDYMKPAYVDLDDERVRTHLRAMNDVLSSELAGTKVDLADQELRQDLEQEIKYCFPDESDLEANADYNELRGIWQLFQPSLRHDHLADKEQWVRTAAFVAYDFVTGRKPSRSAKKMDNRRKDSNDNSTSINLLVVGPTTVWEARGWISAAQKLYIHAQNSRRHIKHRLYEDQFFVFNVPRPRDLYLRHHTFEEKRVGYDKIESIQGVLSGTSLDEKYESLYPAIATVCVARKLNGWSEWFKENDLLIDNNFLSQLRDNLKLDYYPIEQLKKNSHETAFDGRITSARKKNDEAGYRLAELLRLISDSQGMLVKPIVLHPLP